MGELVVFLVLVLVPLGAYLVNAGIANRGLRTIRSRAREAGMKAPAPKPRPAKVTPLRRGTARPNCGRELVHLLLLAVGARDACRYCAALAEGRAAASAPPAGPSPEAADVLAEVERLLDDRHP